MSAGLSANTKAILLLTAPLIAGRGKPSNELLTPSEYAALARHLPERDAQPADLLTPAVARLLGDGECVIDSARIERLLARGFLLSQAVERWQTRAIWVVSRADAAYPQRLKNRLKEASPALLYGCGDQRILESGGLAVVGSRDADDALLEYAEGIGRLAAAAGCTLLSGGARGIDQAAMRGALEAGGRVTGVLADSLERTAMDRAHRNRLLDEQLVLISLSDPSAGFNAGQAMQRNKLIYALADAALVVDAAKDKGGTWAGATEQLQTLRLVPVYVRSTGVASDGLSALAKLGAMPWPNPDDADGLAAVLAAPVPEPSPSPSPEQGRLDVDSRPASAMAGLLEPVDEPLPESAAVPSPDVDESSLTAAEELFGAVRTLVVRLVREPRSAADVALALGVTRRQAEDWLTRLVEEGVLDKSRKPVRYSRRQCGLFEREGSADRAGDTDSMDVRE